MAQSSVKTKVPGIYRRGNGYKYVQAIPEDGDRIIEATLLI